ncbi:delta-lactam-biosynthetic de-N-acetylase [Paenalkalicoccus suaedae]|nr:delta-lactam-biosynthetic de-N-acetylase [Paenalkalicoccus suaedae]
MLHAIMASFILATSFMQWSFDHGTPTTPASSVHEELLEEVGGMYVGDSTQREVYLTFDNGYENGYTAQILDTLKEKQVPAAFFVTGHYVREEPELVLRMIKEGHVVGNHSNHHPSFARLSFDQIKQELEDVEKEVKKLDPTYEMIYVRPPRGEFNREALLACKELGYSSIFWSMAYKDWEVDHQKGKSFAFEQITKRVSPGAVLLLHSVSSDNAQALPDVIDHVKQSGLTFKHLDDWKLREELEPLTH